MYFYKVMVKGKFGIRCYDYIKTKKKLISTKDIINTVINRPDLTHQDSIFLEYLKRINCTKLWVEKISFFEYYKYILFS